MAIFNIYELEVSKSKKKILLEMMLLSSSVWNMANYDFRQAIINNKKIKRYRDLCSFLQTTNDYIKLGRCYSKPKIQKYSFVIESYFETIKSKTQKYVGLPKYYKNRKTNTTLLSSLVVESQLYHFRGNKLYLPLSHQMRKETKLKGLQFKFKNNIRYNGKSLLGEIIYNPIKKKFYFHQSVEVPKVKKKDIKNVVSIDIGVKRGITAFDGENIFMYPNTIIDKYNNISKKISQLQMIAKIRNNRFSTKQIKSLYYKRSILVDNYNKNIVSWFQKDVNPDKIVVGDVKHILESNHNKNNKTNQMIHNLWSFGKFYKLLDNKADNTGTIIEKVSEAYTTITCPKCGEHNVPVDRVYSCSKCGYTNDRDIVGAINIYKQNVDKDCNLYPPVKIYRSFIPNYNSLGNENIKPFEVV